MSDATTKQVDANERNLPKEYAEKYGVPATFLADYYAKSVNEAYNLIGAERDELHDAAVNAIIEKNLLQAVVDYQKEKLMRLQAK